MEKERLLANLEYWFDLLGKDGANTKAMVRNEIKHLIDETKNIVCGILADENGINRYELNHTGVESLYAILNCDCVDVINIDIAGHSVDIWFDDEYMLKAQKEDDPNFAILDENGKVENIIFGNVFICAVDDEGDMTSLDDMTICDILLNAPLTITNNLTKKDKKVLCAII